MQVPTSIGKNDRMNLFGFCQSTPIFVSEYGSENFLKQKIKSRTDANPTILIGALKNHKMTNPKTTHCINGIT